MTVKAYRADIDGLRAVAVVSVILFRAGFEWAGGGFVGVDVFFVISGYLVGGIVLAALERGDFSFGSSSSGAFAASCHRCCSPWPCACRLPGSG